jgi:hypothetical protein
MRGGYVSGPGRDVTALTEKWVDDLTPRDYR